MNEKNESEEIKSDSGIKKYKKTLIALAVIVVFAGLAYLAVNTLNLGGGSKVAANINGVDILQADLQKRFDQNTQQAVSQGVDTTNPEVASQVKSQILKDLINSELLTQAAKEAGIEVTQSDVDSEVALVEKQIGGKEKLLEQLKKIGMNEDAFRKEVLNQLTIQKYLLENIDVASTEATVDEIASAYKQASASTDNIPPLKDVKEQIAKQVSIEKQQKLLDSLIEKLRSKAEIKIF